MYLITTSLIFSLWRISIRNSNLWFGKEKRVLEFLEIFFSKIHLYLPNRNISWKYNRFYWREYHSSKNPPLVSKTTSLDRQNPSPKKVTKAGKTDFGKMREVHKEEPIIMKQRLQFLNICFHRIRICPQRKWLNQENHRFPEFRHIPTF